MVRRLHDYFFPHARNNYRPHFFSALSIALIVAGVLALEGAYFTQVKLVFTQTDFLASVLPGVLATLTNQDRAAAGDAPVVENAVLDKAAAAAAEDMATKGYFAHVSPDGKTPWYWLDQAGYRYSYAGENLAVNFTDSAAVESAWMASPTHHANIVKPQYTEVGFGTADGVYEGKETTFVVTFFAAPAPAAAKPSAAVPVAVSNAPAFARASSTGPAAEVLGTATAAPPVPAAPARIAAPAPSLLAQAFASPLTTVETVLLALLALVASLFTLSALARFSLPHPHVLAGSALLIALGLSAIALNQYSAGTVQLPAGNQSASVVSALGR